MLIRLPGLLTADQVADIAGTILSEDWVDGATTAGAQAKLVKNNRQLARDSEAAQAAGKTILGALERHATFQAAALPVRILPPMFNRYEGDANAYGAHVDNAVRALPGGGRMRADLSATVFLSDPASYDGGELVIEDVFGAQGVKLAAGDLVLYPSSSVHRVAPVTKGCRLAAFFWIESMVRDAGERRILFDLDRSIIELRNQIGDGPAVVRLTSTYHNLLRRWGNVR